MLPNNPARFMKCPAICVALAASMMLPGCAVLQQLDDWSRGPVRYVDPRDVGAKGLPASVTRRRHFIDKFIIWSEVPVEEFYGLPYYTSSH